MRKWLLIGLAVVLVLVGVGVYAAVNLNRYVADNRDWIASQVETVLGRRVAFEKLEVTLLGGVGVTVEDVRIADDPAFSKTDFLTAKRVNVAVRLVPALFGHYELRHIA